MSSTSSIEWTDATWNPVRGCARVSPGCGGADGGGCYAERMAHRFSGPGGPYEGLTRMTAHGPRWTGKVRLVPELLDWPLSKRKPLKIFVNSMADLFHDDVPDEFIARVWQIMGAASWHTYQILTKRPERMRSWVVRWYAGEITEPHSVLPVPGYPGYSVTTHGQVLGKRADTSSGLSFDVGEQGHRRVTMHRDSSPKSGERELVHRLVLEAFARPARAGEQACHRNGDPGDNRLSNLYWGTQESNWRDRISHGRGRAYAKLTAADVAKIRSRCASGEPAASVASDFAVSDTQIRNIASGRQWSTPAGERPSGPPTRVILDSVWLGVSVEDQERADERIPLLLQTPAAVRFISAEPLLGGLDLTPWVHAFNADHDGRGCCETPRGLLHWVIVGGESGPGARECRVDWIRSILAQCHAAGVPAFCKQLGSKPTMSASDWTHNRERGGKGDDPEQWPPDLRVQEFPS